MDLYPVPDLVIEISNTSLADDLGTKRLLYEELGVSEYWVIDSKKTEIIAFRIANGGDSRIIESQVLPGLQLDTMIHALQQSRNTNHSAVSQWLMTQFQG